MKCAVLYMETVALTVAAAAMMVTLRFSINIPIITFAQDYAELVTSIVVMVVNLDTECVPK